MAVAEVADSADLHGGVRGNDGKWLMMSGKFSPFSPQFCIGGVADVADVAAMAVADSADICMM
jgi:hypothetical protein